MDALILLINNGHNPFTGQGGLGYKPNIEMYGYGGLGYKLPIHGGSGKASSTTLIKKAPMSVANIDEDEDELVEYEEPEEEVEVEQPEEEEIVEQEDDPEELQALLLGTEEKIGSVSGVLVLENQVKNLKEQQNKQYNKIRLFETSNPTKTIELRKEVNLLQKDIVAREQAIEIIRNPQRFLQYKVAISFTPEELRELNLINFDNKDFDKSNKKLIKYFNDNNYLVEDLNNSPNIKDLVYIPAFMKKTILKPTGEEAGKSFETNISVPILNLSMPTKIQKKIGKAITNESGSLIISNDELLKSKKYKGYKQFCYDNVDNINHWFIECKKYDGKESFKNLYDEYVKQYNDFYLKFLKEIEDDKTSIQLLEQGYEDFDQSKEETIELLEMFDLNSKKELKALLKTYNKSLSDRLESVKTNGVFDENKFKLKFYKETAYAGITIGINKFPKPSDWSGVNSANDEECFNEIKKNRGTHYDVQVDKTGNNFGYISNIKYESFGVGTKASILETKNKNKVIQECYDFENNYYGLIFNIACDDAMITFNYTNFMREKIGKYEDITNIFRGNFSFYSMGASTTTKYDSVVIPIDCFVPINLKNIYGNL